MANFTTYPNENENSGRVKAIGIIYLAWRKGKGSHHTIVGVIHKCANNGVRFRYLKNWCS